MPKNAKRTTAKATSRVSPLLLNPSARSPEPFSHSQAIRRSQASRSALLKAQRNHSEALEAFATTAPTSADFAIAVASLDDANTALILAHEAFSSASRTI